MPEAALRRAVGLTAAVFGLLHLLPVAFVALSAGGPAPVTVSARAWSVFFYAHFVALAATGFAIQLLSAWKSKLFHGGPLIDFLLGIGGFMLLESISGVALKGGSGAAVFALVPGVALIAFGARLRTGRPLLGA